MEKKNPYMFTLLFNKNDPEHRKVAELLNKMGHDKAKYITEAVIFYQGYRESGEIKKDQVDYPRIEEMIAKVVEERLRLMAIDEKESGENYHVKEKTGTSGFSGDAVQGIIESLDWFRDS